MKIIKQSVFFFLFLALVIIGGFAIGGYFSKNHMNNMPDSHQRFHEMLDFTPDQLDKLNPIEKKYSEQKLFYENQIHQANMELGEIMRTEKSYTPKVQEAVEKIHAAMGHLQKVTLVHFFDMRLLLDDRQARILDNYVMDALHAH